MTRRRASPTLWLQAGVLLALALLAPQSADPWPFADAVAAAAAVGATLAAAAYLAVGAPPPTGGSATGPTLGFLTARAVGEEALWRGLALPALVPVVGAPAALGLTTAGFAVSHAPRQGRRALVHVGTGATFGAAVLATGRLGAAIAAHATYNAVLFVARRRPFRTVGGGRTAPYPRRTSRLSESRTGAAASPGDPAAAAELVGVSKRYGASPALVDVDLAVARGKVVAILGANGAGKTTAVSLLLGLRRPDAGSVRLLGRDPRDRRARVPVGAMPQEIGFPPTLRVREVVELVRSHYPDPEPTGALLDGFGLAAVARRQTGGLSGGMRRRLGVALAFAGRPSLVFLDEPTSGLDVATRRDVWARVRDFAGRGGTVVLTTHYLEEADALASCVAILHRGRVLATGTPAEVKARAGLSRIRVRIGAVPRLPGILRVDRSADRVTLVTRDVDGTVRALVESRVPFSELEVVPLTLEEAFLELTGAAS